MSLQKTWDQNISAMLNRKRIGKPSIKDINSLEYWRYRSWGWWTCEKVSKKNKKQTDLHKKKKNITDGLETNLINLLNYWGKCKSHTEKEYLPGKGFVQWSCWSCQEIVNIINYDSSIIVDTKIVFVSCYSRLLTFKNIYLNRSQFSLT